MLNKGDDILFLVERIVHGVSHIISAVIIVVIDFLSLKKHFRFYVGS